MDTVLLSPECDKNDKRDLYKWTVTAAVLESKGEIYSFARRRCHVEILND